MKDLVLNWGLVSAGLLAQDFCTAVLYLNSPYQKIRAVAAKCQEDAIKFAKQFGVSAYYGSYDELYADADVNIVFIATNNAAHKENCLKAIQAGKHVVCEKPVALNSQDLEEVLGAAESRGVFFMEGLWTRFFPVIDLLEKELENKTIGEVKFFNSSILLPIKNIPRVREKKLGGGTFFEIGIYPVQLACLAMKNETPLQISACGHLMETGVDESVSITMLYTNNRIAQISFSSACSKFAPTYVVGEKGCIQIPNHSWCPTELIVNNETHRIPLPGVKTNFDNTIGLKFEVEAVRLAIANGLKEHPYVSHDHSRLIMQIVSEAIKQLNKCCEEK